MEFGQQFRNFRCELGSFLCPKAATWVRLFYFPSEGRNAVDFSYQSRRKNPTASVGKITTECLRIHRKIKELSHNCYARRWRWTPVHVYNRRQHSARTWRGSVRQTADCWWSSKSSENCGKWCYYNFSVFI
jgi:hypothetical protein